MIDRREPRGRDERPPRRQHLPGLLILHEDQQLLVVDKSSGLLTIATEADRDRTAYRLLMDYVRRGYSRASQRIFIVHRLDRDTSGVLVFAKTEPVKRQLQEDWKDVRKTYLAVVHGTPAKPEGRITSYLAENAAHRVYSTPDASKGQWAQTAWRVLKTVRAFCLLEVDLITGRKNQIRVHLAESGHPVVGDRKYGRAADPHKLLALHARSIAFTHPVTGARLVFEAAIPRHIARLMGQADLLDSHHVAPKNLRYGDKREDRRR
jgi:RluA family pseudouridine synthase